MAQRFLTGEAERELVVRFCRGDPDALYELVEAYHGWLLRILHGVLNNAHDAEAILYESAEKAFFKHASFDPDGPERWVTWFLKIAVHRAHDHWRLSKRQRKQLDSLMEQIKPRKTRGTRHDPIPEQSDEVTLTPEQQEGTHGNTEPKTVPPSHAAALLKPMRPSERNAYVARALASDCVTNEQLANELGQTPVAFKVALSRGRSWVEANVPGATKQVKNPNAPERRKGGSEDVSELRGPRGD